MNHERDSCAHEFDTVLQALRLYPDGARPCIRRRNSFVLIKLNERLSS